MSESETLPWQEERFALVRENRDSLGIQLERRPGHNGQRLERGKRSGEEPLRAEGAPHKSSRLSFTSPARTQRKNRRSRRHPGNALNQINHYDNKEQGLDWTHPCAAG